jgi:histidinol-phosphatase (PHP family)
MEALEAAARAGVVLEINTGGLSRGKTDSFYPSAWILKEARRLGIPITINADAHTAAGIDAMFSEAADAARAAGYREKRVLLGGRWQDVPL